MDYTEQKGPVRDCMMHAGHTSTNTPHLHPSLPRSCSDARVKVDNKKDRGSKVLTTLIKTPCPSSQY